MEEMEVVKKTKYVTFKSGDEYFGIDIQYVSEIIVFQEITKVPESEDYIKGLINLRGKIIPVIDVRIRFKQEPFEYDDRTCIIVVKVRQTVVGLIVEKIAEVVEIGEDNVIPSPTLAKLETPQNRYVYGIGKVGNDVKILLDPDKLLNDEDLGNLEKTLNNEEDEAEAAVEEKPEPQPAPAPIKPGDFVINPAEDKTENAEDKKEVKAGGRKKSTEKKN